jgi:hypothetical protein
VFRLDDSNWVEEQKLLASDGVAGDMFGTSVALSGDSPPRIVVGAYGVDARAGAAYVFRYEDSSWVQEQRLTAFDGAADDMFGYALAVADGPPPQIVVGAYGDDDSGSLSGSAYAFSFDGSSWQQEQKLLASDGGWNHIFGKSLAASANVALIGSHRDDDLGGNSGSAYVFRFNGVDWIEEAKLLASDGATGDRFAWSLGIAGHIAVVAAHKNDDQGTDSGAAYVFPGLSDCNVNDTLDLCEVAAGTSPDADGDGLPDECGPVVPAASQVGLIVMAVLLLTAGAAVNLRRRRATRGRPPGGTFLPGTEGAGAEDHFTPRR